MTGSTTFMTRKEAADYLDVSVPSLARWASQGIGPAYYKLGRQTRYLQADLDAFIESRRKPGIEGKAA
jgi:excisionase family DNA binding protein